MATSSGQITIKSDIEHIRLRPGMYIGSTYDPNHLLQEIIDNSLDELINNYATELKVFFVTDKQVVVTDNGRGIPIHDIEVESGVKECSLIAASTRLKSGAKFDNNAYEHSIGLHGIGLVAVNALSKSMRISVKNQNNPNQIYDVQFVESELKSFEIIECENIDWSTRIEFEVDPKYFTIPTFSKFKFIDQFKLTSAKFPNSKLFVDDQQIYSENMESFVREKLEIDESIPLINWNFQSTTDIRQYNEDKTVSFVPVPISFDIYFTYELDGAGAFKEFGDVNLRSCSGRYLTNFRTCFANAIIAKYGDILSKTEIISNFRLYISCFIPDPEFDSQSKSNMSKDLKCILDKGRTQLERLVTNSFIKSCIDSLVEIKTLKKVNKKITKTKGRVSAKNPLKDCLKTPGETLWLLEGESAMGNLLKVRDVKTEGVFPLTGKILNVVSKSLDQVADSKKFRFLFEALGADIKTKNQSNYRFNEIKILCDADPDGHHIVVLLLMGIWYYFPYFLNNNKVKIIIPPLYGAYQNNQFIPIYSADDVKNYKNYRRYKGIGEMNASELEVIIRGGGVEYIPQPPVNNDEAEALIRCLDDTELKRRLCSEVDKFNINNLFTSNDLIN